MSITVVFADDQPTLRTEIRQILANDALVEVVATAKNGIEALQLIKKFQPDIAILDVAMPELSGIETTNQLTEISCRTQVIALSMHADTAYVRGMMQAGAKGYVLKDCAAEELTIAIHTVAAGQTYLSPDINAER